MRRSATGPIGNTAERVAAAAGARRAQMETELEAHALMRSKLGGGLEAPPTPPGVPRSLQNARNRMFGNNGGNSPASSAAGSARQPQAFDIGGNQRERQAARLRSMRASEFKNEVLGGLGSIPAAYRGTECTKRREKIRMAISFMDEVLDESEETLKLKPVKSDKTTAAAYHSCFRQLHWILGRCQQMQELAEVLENHDSGRLIDREISADYSQLSLDIFSRYDRAQQQLAWLRQVAEEADEEGRAGQGCLPNRAKHGGGGGPVAEWLVNAMTICATRNCVRHNPCTARDNWAQPMHSS